MLSNRNSFTKDTATISLFNGLGAVSSFAIDAAIATVFGLGAYTDAFFVAATLPLLSYFIFNRVAELALVPVFVGWDTRLGEQMWRPFSILLIWVFVCLTIVTLLAIISSRLLFYAVAPGLSANNQELVVLLGTWMLMSIPLNGIIAVCRARLNASKAFAASTSSNLVRNIVVLVFVGLAFVGPPVIERVAQGYVVAALFQTAVLFFFLIRYQFRFVPSVDFRDGEVKTAVKSLLFPLVSFSINQSNEIVERFLASFLPAGSLSALVFARRIVAVLVNIFLNSTSSAIIPLLAKLAASKDMINMQKTMQRGIKLVLLIALPITVWVGLLHKSLLRFALLRGAMDESQVQLIASLLLLYVIALPLLGLVQLLIAPHYALEDVRTPTVHLLLMLTIQIALDILLFRFIGLPGIPIALGLTATVSVLRAFWLLKQKNIAVITPSLLSVITKLGLAAIAMGITIYIIQLRWIEGAIDRSMIAGLGLIAISILCGSIVSLIVAKMLKLTPSEFVIG